MDNCGIYEISCGETGRRYVGSSCDASHRTKGHFQDLRANRHCNTEFQKDFNLYSESFDWRLIESCSEMQLLEREEHWINLGENLYNITNPN